MVSVQPADQPIRIFLASPSADTQDARKTVIAAVAAVQQEPAYRALRLDLLHWDNTRRRIVCDRGHNTQHDIEAQLGNPGSCDLVIGLFAGTMGGTLTDDAAFGRPGPDRLWHCAEWEVEQGLRSQQRRKAGQPDGRTRAVWVLRDTGMPPDVLQWPQDRQTAYFAGAQAVTRFVDRANPADGPSREGKNFFKSVDDLDDLIRQGLRDWLTREFLAAPLAEAKPGQPPAAPVDLRPYLTRRSSFWRTGAAGQLDRRFVNLTLMVDHGLAYDGPRYAEAGKYDLLSQLLAERSDVGAWVLVGAPGSGKSTVLQHHEMSTAAEALRQLDAGAEGAAAAATTDPRPELCIWHRLSEYSADSPPPDDWLALPGRWPQDLPPPQALRGVVRLRYLLDGLNEIKAPDRSAQLAAIERWTTWAAAQATRGDVLAPLFSVRTLDQSPMSTGSDFEVRQIVLAPWRSDQIRDYCAGSLGADNQLWPAIQADAALLQLSELPFNLWAQCELFRTLGRAARDRAELMGGLFWQMLVRRVSDAPLKAAGLLGDADRQHIASGKWKTTLRALPDRHGCLVPWLDDALQRLHRRGRQVSVTRDELLQGLESRAGWATPEHWLYAVRSLELIGDGGADEFSPDPLLRCNHQLWQEFFAARGIRHLATADPAQLPKLLPDLRAPELPALADVIAQLGVQEPLPGPDPTHWEEPVKLAVQLVPDPLPWLRLLEPVNLALAGRAAIGCRAQVDKLHGPRVLDGLRQALLARSRDPAVDLRLRIEAGLVLGELGDPRYEERNGPHGRYLWPRQWVSVPGGVYTIGDDDSGQPDEGPETDVTLDPFAMAWAPVTNAEYRCFVEAGGYQDERWWQGETALRWLKEGVRNEAEIERWRAILVDIRRDPAAWIARRTLTESIKETVHAWAKQSEADDEAMLEQWFGARRYELPQEWLNPVFNAASQPVVGICQFEAQAYLAWLCAQRGLPPGSLRLPTEAEWEAAARGPNRRHWPWGDTDPAPGQINADPAHLRRTSPVGVFVEADSPEGLADLAGNVQEWTLSAYTDQHDTTALTTAAPDGLARRVVRGGSWDDPAEVCRAAFRDYVAPVNRVINLGFRVVSCPIQGTAP